VLPVGETVFEGPVWRTEGGREGGQGQGYLLFSNVKSNQIMKWTDTAAATAPAAEAAAAVILGPVAATIPPNLTVFATQAGCFLPPSLPFCSSSPIPGTNGLGTDPVTGKLVSCMHGERAVVRWDEEEEEEEGREGGKGWKRTVLVSRYGGKRLSSPNDLVFGKNGDLFFTDPPYGLADEGKEEGGREGGREQPFIAGVYRVPAAAMARLEEGSREGVGEGEVELLTSGREGGRAWREGRTAFKGGG
jgi:gluconolactonase